MAFEPLPLDEDDVEELGTLAKVSDKLPSILSKSEEVGPRVGTIPMARLLSRRLGIAFDDLLPTINSLVRLHKLRSELNRTGDEIVELAARSLEQVKAADELKTWSGASGGIAKAVSALTPEHPIVVSHEAGLAAQSRSHIVGLLDLFTDARPVFNESRDKILFTIISHTLVVEYHDAFRRHGEIHLSLDAADLEYLQFLCAQAELAAKTLKGLIDSPAGVPLEDDEGGEE